MKNIDNLFFISEAKDHLKNKETLLKEIESFGTFSYTTHEQQIFNTDYHVKEGLVKYTNTYDNIFYPIVGYHLHELKQYFNYKNFKLQIAWYQQYLKGDYHGWHNHNNCVFSSVYYLELPEGCSKTTFMVDGKEKEIEVKEGQILTFASYLRHCSKPSKTDKRKTIIAFNSNGCL